MTTKELCDALRHTHPSRTMCKDAANEIERLAEQCADAQKLAFEWMERHDKVVGFISKNYPTVMMPNFPIPVARAIERLEARLSTPTCPDQTGGNSNAYYSNVASAKASPSYQHAPICKCRGLD
jgi:hypothetical protein